MTVRALLEGEASVIGWGIQARASGTTPSPEEWDRYFDELESTYLGQVSASISGRITDPAGAGVAAAAIRNTNVIQSKR